MTADEMMKCMNLQADILKITDEAGYLAAIGLNEYPMTLSLHEDASQLSLFPDDARPGTCCISFADNSLHIETNGEFNMSEDCFTKLLRKFKKCCVEYALTVHRGMYEGGSAEMKKEPD